MCPILELFFCSMGVLELFHWTPEHPQRHLFMGNFQNWCYLGRGDGRKLLFHHFDDLTLLLSLKLTLALWTVADMYFSTPVATGCH